MWEPHRRELKASAWLRSLSAARWRAEGGGRRTCGKRVLGAACRRREGSYRAAARRWWRGNPHKAKAHQATAERCGCLAAPYLTATPIALIYNVCCGVYLQMRRVVSNTSDSLCGVLDRLREQNVTCHVSVECGEVRPTGTQQHGLPIRSIDWGYKSKLLKLCVAAMMYVCGKHQTWHPTQRQERRLMQHVTIKKACGARAATYEVLHCFRKNKRQRRCFDRGRRPTIVGKGRTWVTETDMQIGSGWKPCQPCLLNRERNAFADQERASKTSGARSRTMCKRRHWEEKGSVATKHTRARTKV